MFRWVLVGWVGGCTGNTETPVGATLDDGQVLVGGITTPRLHLAGAFGEVEVPLEDVGMVLPVEGLTLGDSHGQVTVWLRNGSELKGKWAEPELSMAITVGGRQVSVDVPTERMQTLQLRASEAWPSLDLFRVRTTWGDDFLIDPQQTRITVNSKLGVFEVTLAECLTVGPVGEPTGDWRFVLDSGTVLIGPAKEAELSFVLPMGPDRIVVPLTALASLERGGWTEGTIQNVESNFARMVAPPEAVDASADAGSGVAAPASPVQKVLAKPGLSRSAGWFDNVDLENAKR